MDRARWEKVIEVYHAASEREPVRRSAFLTDACEGDDELRSEVESLLRQDLSQGDMLERIAEDSRKWSPAAKLDSRQMMLSVGTQLAHYEILGLLGAGGMGEVYRARDLKLKREVAIKTLPEEFSRDADRVSRFQREAEVLAALNHPNIAIIHDVQEANETRFLVMELVEGETLAQRIQHGPIPVEEALEIGGHICEALEAAHERGVVHRDLKPANVKITPDGKVKVLDFGLAKAVPSGARGAAVGSNSPTFTLGGIEGGVILGTASYMSPEQATGKSVDRRADIWTFGVVLWEMLVGAQLFSGETVSHTLADVLRAETDFSKLPAKTPAPIRELLKRCLDRDVKTRLRDIGEARVAIQRWLQNPAPEANAAPSQSRSRWTSTLGWIAAGALVLMFGGLWFWTWPATSDPRTVVRFASTLPLANVENGLAFSRDGSRLAFVGGPQQQIYVRMMDQIEARPLPGTEGAFFLSFSPDGEWISFVSNGRFRERLGTMTGDMRLKKVSLSGGPPQTLAEFSGPVAPHQTWGEDGNILFDDGPLKSISSNGGQVKTVAALDEKNGERFFTGLQLLPGARAILASTSTNTTLQRVVVVNPKTGERKVLLERAGIASYLPVKPGSSSGHIIYYDPLSGSLMAVPFDAGALVLTGSPIPLLEDVRSITGPYGAFAFSESGTLAYVPGAALQGPRRTLVWVDRKGVEQPLPLPPRSYSNLRLSPDGERAVFTIFDPSTGRSDNWVYDLIRGAPSRMTSENFNSLPVWTPDGKRLVWATGANQLSKKALVSGPADNSGPPTVLLPDSGIPEAISPDGKLIVIRGDNQSGTLIFSLAEPPSPTNPQVFGEKQALGARFSPDGQLIAYTSNESGRNEVYVQSFSGPSGKWTISTNGGQAPSWSRSGRELFYRQGNRLMAVAIERGPSFRASKPAALFEQGYFNNVSAVSPDGMRFLVIKDAPSVEKPPEGPLQIIVNWSEELVRRLPLK